MKANWLVFILLLISNFSAAQNVVFGIAVDGTYRYKGFHKEGFTEEEYRQLLKLEVVKPSYSAYLGYLFNLSPKLDMQATIGYRILRFGSLIYTVPPGVPNHTPQAGKIREFEKQKQFLAGVLLYFKNARLLKSTVFTESFFVYNRKHYMIRSDDFDLHNKKIFSGGGISSESFKHHPIDLYLGAGLSWELLKKKILVQPHLGLFITPYKTSGINYKYLIFNKDVKGYLLDAGVNITYKINTFKWSEVIK